jgi:hypothetical protein
MTSSRPSTSMASWTSGRVRTEIAPGFARRSQARGSSSSMPTLTSPSAIKQSSSRPSTPSRPTSGTGAGTSALSRGSTCGSPGGNGWACLSGAGRRASGPPGPAAAAGSPPARGADVRRRRASGIGVSYSRLRPAGKQDHSRPCHRLCQMRAVMITDMRTATTPVRRSGWSEWRRLGDLNPGWARTQTALAVRSPGRKRR